MDIKLKANQFKAMVESHNEDINMDVEDYERFLEAYPEVAPTAEGERVLLEVLRNQGYDV